MDVLYLAIAVLVLDAIWIGGYLISPFSKMIHNVQGGRPMQVRPIGVIIAYVVLLSFIWLFLPKMKNATEAFLLGFLLYAVYDSTNYATLVDWDAKVAILDSIWGGVLFWILFNIQADT